MIRVLFTLCISTWMVGCASPIDMVVPQETVLSAEEICIPVQMNVGLPLVDVHINGRGPFTFLIDTGAGAPAVLDDALAEELGLARRPEISFVVTTPTGRKVRLDGAVEIPSLRIPGAEFHTLVGATHDLSELTAGLDGIVSVRRTQPLDPQRAPRERGAGVLSSSQSWVASEPRAAGDAA